MLAGLLTWCALCKRTLVAQSKVGNSTAKIELVSPPLASLSHNTALLTIEVDGKPKGNASLLDGFFDYPRGIVPLSNNCFMLLFDFDISFELGVFDPNLPPTMNNLSHTSLGFIVKKTNMAVRYPDSSEIAQALDWVCSRSNREWHQSFSPTLWAGKFSYDPGIASLSNQLAAVRMKQLELEKYLYR